MPYNVLILNSLYGLAVRYPTIGHLASITSGLLSYVGFPILFMVTVLYPSGNMAYWVGLSLASVGATWIIAETVKRLLRIPRPFLVLADIKPFTTPFGYAFPSEHAAVYASLAVLALFYNPYVGIIFIFIALLVGVSRVILGVHYPADIVAGFIVGALVTFFFAVFFSPYI